MDNPYLEALKNALRFGKDTVGGLNDVVGTLGSGMIAQPIAGLAGLNSGAAELLRGRGFSKAGEKARQTMDRTSEALTYQPRTDVGERAVENVGKGIEKVTKPIMENVVDPIGERSPMTGAMILAGAELVGPKGGKPKPHVKAKPHVEPHTPQFDPGSAQQLIPGVEPLTSEQAYAEALRRHDKAEAAMSFEDPNAGMRFDYSRDWRGAGPAWAPDFNEGIEGQPRAKRPVGRVTNRPVPLSQIEGPGERTTPQGARMSSETVQAHVGQENFQRMQELAENLRNAEGDVRARGQEHLIPRAREANMSIQSLRALRNEPNINDLQRLTIEEEILREMRNRPIDVSGRILIPQPGEGDLTPVNWRDMFGEDANADARGYFAEHPEKPAQARIVRRLRGLPEQGPLRVRPPERLHEGAPDSFEDIPGRDPNAMNREAVDAFLKGASGNESMFQYGVMPPENVRSLDDFAQHFSRKSGEDVDVDWDYADGDSDEPYKIKREKEHGRGEIMRDSYGEYKLDPAEGGETQYDDYGNPKVKEKEIELVGPPLEGESGLFGTKEIEKTHERGDYYRDDSGEWQYKKSRGGEAMRDERGNTKYEEVENPDYRESSDVDQATLRGPKGEISIKYDDPEAFITATEAGGKGGGQLLYQIALAHAARAGIDIGGAGLTDINSYRLLSNVLSNIARSGVNPRDVAGTKSGPALRARGQAEGPEVWRAEAEEGMHRLREAGVDPNRVQFDPAHGFSVDGQAASPDDIRNNVTALSPNVTGQGAHGGVGQKSLMRNAVFQWLRTATPEEATRAALKWPKEWGPIFAGIGAAAVGAGALQSEDASAKTPQEISR